MANEPTTNLTADKIRSWLQNLNRFDPELASSLKARSASFRPSALTAEGAMAESVAARQDVQFVVETMVRPGRPVFPIREDVVVREPALIEPPDGELMLQRLLAAAPALNPIIPLIGRIDVANFPFQRELHWHGLVNRSGDCRDQQSRR